MQLVHKRRTLLKYTSIRHSNLSAPSRPQSPPPRGHVSSTHGAPIGHHTSSTRRRTTNRRLHAVSCELRRTHTTSRRLHATTSGRLPASTPSRVRRRLHQI
ncbi:hypothetical protein ACS0TY_015797 [Phlomoides rotata]